MGLFSAITGGLTGFLTGGPIGALVGAGIGAFSGNGGSSKAPVAKTTQRALVSRGDLPPGFAPQINALDISQIGAECMCPPKTALGAINLAQKQLGRRRLSAQQLLEILRTEITKMVLSDIRD